MKPIIIATLLAASLSVAAQAEPEKTGELKVGYVNTQRLFRDAPIAVKAQKKLDAEFSKRDQDLKKLAGQLKSMQEGFEKDAMTLAESERRNREREIAELGRDIQRKQREFREDLNLRQNEEMAAVLERANQVIKQIAETERFDLILQDAVFVSQRLDITNKVIKALGEGKDGGK